MSQRKKLKDVKCASEFECGYWYALELKAFAREIGVPNRSRLRKDELDKIILRYFEEGEVRPGARKSSRGERSPDRLALDGPIRNYVGNAKTKAFIKEQARILDPNLPKKSGVWYWTNRWREEMLQANKRITYGDLVRHFVELCNQEGRLAQIPSARFNNFITDFLSAKEGDKEAAKLAWEKLKTLDIPKTYAAWSKYRS